MRPRRSNVVRGVVAAVFVGGAIRGARAQTSSPSEGALEFILPTGARVLGMGQAAVTTATGSEALWWNPALVARGPREVALGFVSNVQLPASDVTLAAVYPVPKVATFALSLRYVSNGEQDASDSTGTKIGALVPRTTTAAASFAAPFGDRLAVGVSFKLLAVSYDCTGQCNTTSATPLTGAIDFGGQYIFTKDSLVSLGLAVRNLGLPLQVNDAPQSDELPSRVDLGVSVSPRFANAPDARLVIAGDFVSRLSARGGSGFRFGSELSWLNQYFGRAGYVVNGPNGSGPTFGLGIAHGKWRVDFAQFLSDFGGENGSKPTYLSLRYVF